MVKVVTEYCGGYSTFEYPIPLDLMYHIVLEPAN